MYPSVLLKETVFTHISTVGNHQFVHCDVTGRSRKVSTLMFFECFILIFKQARSILIKPKSLSMPFNKYTTHVFIFISLHHHQKLTLSTMSTPQYHEINVMTFDAECHKICFVGRKTNGMTLMFWDLENVTRFIFSRAGARFGCDLICFSFDSIFDINFALFVKISMPTLIAKFMGPTWGPFWSCRPQMGPMLAPWTLLSGQWSLSLKTFVRIINIWEADRRSHGIPVIGMKSNSCYLTCVIMVILHHAMALASKQTKVCLTFEEILE